jgi:hypothetical protein
VKASPIHVGDFAYCRSKYYRDQLQLPEEVGLVIEIKRNNFKILYPNDKRCWLPREALTRVRPEHLEYATFLEQLHYIIKRVHALDCELVSEEDRHRLTLRIDRLDDHMIDDLRQFLGDSPDVPGCRPRRDGLHAAGNNSGTVAVGDRPNYFSKMPML